MPSFRSHNSGAAPTRRRATQHPDARARHPSPDPAAGTHRGDTRRTPARAVAVRAWRVVENNGEPPLPRRISRRIAQHLEPGSPASPYTIATVVRRCPRCRRLIAAPRDFNRCGADRLHSRCSGPPTDSPSAWPKSHTGPARSARRARPPRTGTQPLAHNAPTQTQPAPATPPAAAADRGTSPGPPHPEPAPHTPAEQNC